MNELTSNAAKRLSRLGQRAVYGLALLEAAETNSNIVALSGDLGNSSGLDRFRSQFPERYINIGIAEQNMVGFASGMSTLGYNCFASSFAPFITMRSCEQVRLNLGYMQSNVKIVSIGSGISMGYLGNSHFGLEDIAIINSIPNIPIICPADTSQVYEAVRFLSNYSGPAYLRLTGVAGEETVYKDSVNVEIGGSNTINNGEDILVLSYGSTLQRCKVAVQSLNNLRSGSIHLEDVYSLRPLNTKLLELVRRFNKIMVVEEHRETGGLFTCLSQYTATEGLSKQWEHVSLPDRFLISGSYQELSSRYGLDIEGITRKLNSLHFK